MIFSVKYMILQNVQNDTPLSDDTADNRFSKYYGDKNDKTVCRSKGLLGGGGASDDIGCKMGSLHFLQSIFFSLLIPRAGGSNE